MSPWFGLCACTGANKDAKHSFPTQGGLSTCFLSDLMSRHTVANGQRQLPSVLPLPVQWPSGHSATIVMGNRHSLLYFTKHALYQAMTTGGCNSFILLLSASNVTGPFWGAGRPWRAIIQDVTQEGAEKAWGCLYCCKPKLEEDSDGYRFRLQHTHRSMADVFYYLKPLPKYCSVWKKISSGSIPWRPCFIVEYFVPFVIFLKV